MDQSVEHIVKVYAKAIEPNNSVQYFEKVSNMASSGASGAFVGAMLALFGKNAQVVSGMDFVADLTDLER